MVDNDTCSEMARERPPNIPEAVVAKNRLLSCCIFDRYHLIVMSKMWAGVELVLSYMQQGAVK